MSNASGRARSRLPDKADYQRPTTSNARTSNARAQRHLLSLRLRNYGDSDGLSVLAFLDNGSRKWPTVTEENS